MSGPNRVCMSLAALACLAATAAGGDEGVIFDVPMLNGIAIDAKADDWGDGGFRVEAMAGLDGRTKPVADLDARFRLGWDKRGLLLLLNVRDDSFVESADEGKLYEKDGVEIYMADRRGGSEMIQAVIAPGLAADQPKLRLRIYDYRKAEVLKKVTPTLTAARTRTDGGYTMEVLLPWKNLAFEAKSGAELAFQIFVNDFDKTEGLFGLVWYPAVGTFMHSGRTHRIRLSNKPAPPVLATARACNDGTGCTWATVVGVRELVGKAVAVLADGNEIVRGTLTDDGGRAFANLKGRVALPRPVPVAGGQGLEVGTEWQKLDILVDGKTTDTFTRPDLLARLDMIAARFDVRSELNFVFRPFCFAGTNFPGGEFEYPLKAESVLGTYALKITYYDAEFNPVTTPGKPGRYGAIVEVLPETGPAFKRFYTLFRTAEGVDWKDTPFSSDVQLPAQLGLDTNIVREQSEVIGNYARDCVADGMSRSPDGAALLAWLHETAPGTRAVERTGSRNHNARWIHELKRKTGNLTPLDYLIHVPPAAEQDKSKKWPTILFLHGAGSDQGTDLSLVYAPYIKAELPAYGKGKEEFPFIIVAPQCPANDWWGNNCAALDDFFATVAAKYPIDANRVYLTGQSMGGYGSWRWAIEHPDRFAAVVPLCGGGDPRDVERLKDVPVWVFHGAKDTLVPVERSYEMVEALRKVHGRVRLTVFPEGHHWILERVYRTDELYPWLLRQVRGKPDQPQATVTSTAPSE